MEEHDDLMLLLRRAVTMTERFSASDTEDNAEDVGGVRSLWSAVASKLLVWLESAEHVEFEAGFRAVGDALRACGPAVRQIAVRALFGDFVRRAIATGFDRRRMVEWFGPAELLEASSGRARGRVLYFSKGRGKVLGADGTIYFVHFGMIQGESPRFLHAGQLTEFSPRVLVANAGTVDAATYVLRLTELGMAQGGCG